MFSLEAHAASCPSRKLSQANVLAILKRGKRLSQPDLELRFLFASPDRAQSTARMVIAVPKRLIKSAVARNRIKRLVREGFRGHAASTAPLHMMVTLKAKVDGKRAETRKLLRGELAKLLDDVARRAMTAVAPARAI